MHDRMLITIVLVPSFYAYQLEATYETHTRTLTC